jgi:hypothetical protein
MCKLRVEDKETVEHQVYNTTYQKKLIQKCRCRNSIDKIIDWIGVKIRTRVIKNTAAAHEYCGS